MLIPFPYDWIYWWKGTYKIKMSKKAEDELVDMFMKVGYPDNKK